MLEISLLNNIMKWLDKSWIGLWNCYIHGTIGHKFWLSMKHLDSLMCDTCIILWFIKFERILVIVRYISYIMVVILLFTFVSGSCSNWGEIIEW